MAHSASHSSAAAAQRLGARPRHLRVVPQHAVEMLEEPPAPVEDPSPFARSAPASASVSVAKAHSVLGLPSARSRPAPPAPAPAAPPLVRLRNFLTGLPLLFLDRLGETFRPLSFVLENVGVLLQAALLICLPAAATAAIYFEGPGVAQLNPLGSARGWLMIGVLYLGVTIVWCAISFLAREIGRGLQSVVLNMERRGASFFRGEG